MKANKIVSLLILIALIITSLPARDISVDEAVDLALNSSLQMESAKLELASLKRQSKDSWGTLLPSINATGTLGKNNRYSPSYPENDPFLNFNFSFSFSFSPAMITSIKATKQSYLNGLLTYEQAKAELKVDVEKLYYAIVLLEESLNIQKNSLQIKKDRMDQARIDYENGFVPEIYVLNTEVTYENAKPEVDEVELSLAANKRSFAFLLGLDINEEINLTDPVDLKIVDIEEDKMLDNIGMRYDLSSITNSAKLINLNRRALREQAFLPSFNLSASHSPYINIDGDNWTKSKNYIDASGKVTLTVAYNLTNLFPQSSVQQNIKKLNETEKNLNVQYRMAEEGAKIEILSLLDRIKTTKEQISNFDRTVQLAEKSYAMTEESYNNGTTDYLTLKDSEYALEQAKLGRLSSQFDYLSALIDLEYATQQNIR